eukprot:TRINITY_DN149_c0_g1_i1.p1 TRINITY_DN149_c0_g1~~TRINITY_DN149_c0_g1_i1.p1  ORF type:complete len:515 (-),score=81.57 TRINITY_DN149_c0_g1_i1:1830-3374(-)
MATPIVSDLPFTERIDMREKALAWISRDTGLQEFLVPDELTTEWSAEQKKVWTTTVIDRFISARQRVGREARARVFARENSSWLRRACVRLQQDLADHRDLTRMAVLLETLWNEVSATFSDSKWAECSIMFDSALISLRVAYVWLYDKIENEDADLHSRQNVFETVVNSFFNIHAPTDDKADKHSSNFRALQRVWRTEFENYTNANDLDAKLKRLEQSQNLMKVATAVSRFLNAINVDASWMWEMQKLQEDIKVGNVKRRKTPRKRREPAPEPPEPESSGSYQPRVEDSDFDIEIAEKRASVEDEDNESEGESDELMRGSMSQRKNNGTMVRRSVRVAQAKSVRYRPTREERRGRHRRSAARRASLRFSESPTPSLSDDTPIARRARITKRAITRTREEEEFDPNEDVADVGHVVKLTSRVGTRRATPRSGISRGRVRKDARRTRTIRNPRNLAKDAEDEDNIGGEFKSYGTGFDMETDEFHGGLDGSTIGGSIPGAPVSFPDRRSRLLAMLES